MSAFTICQISDMHITFKKGKTNKAIDVIVNFEKVLNEVIKITPDLIVLSGDLCFKKSNKKIYAYVKDKMDSCGFPYTVMAGNHDKSNSLADIFGYSLSPGGDLYYTKEIGHYLLIFADSSRFKISNDQLERISQDLKTKLKPVLFIHHPPVMANVPFMDRKYPLKNMDVLQRFLARYKGEIPVFCGHYHNDKEFKKGNLSVFLTPSTYFQISSQTGAFEIASSAPGWRNIILSRKIKTEVQYL